jgi:sodium/proline symporter
MMAERLATTFGFALYLLVILIIGWIAYRQTRGVSDYLLGGRRLGRWVSALSAGASDMSGWLMLGLPGLAYIATGEAVWVAVGLLIGTYLNWRLVAPRLRTYTLATDSALTLPEFLRRRFVQAGTALQLVSALFILVFFLIYTTSGLVAGAKLFEAAFELPYRSALTLGTVAIVLYTVLGGFLAVSWTDVVQALLMVAALVALPVIGIAAAGDTITLEPTPGQWIIASSGTPLTGLAIASLLGWGLGYFGQPHVLARFMATRNALEITAARRIALVWTLLGLVGAIAVGLSAGWILGPTAGDGDHEKVFILLAQTLLHPLVAGVLLAAILAAIMSTADSQLLVTSSALAEDLYRPLSGGQGGERRLLTISRIAVLGLALLAYWLASDPSNGVLELVSYAWAGFGAAFGPVVLAALHWDRTSGWGALAGILVGGLVVLAWRQLDGGVFELYELLPAFVLSTLALIGVSLLGPAPPGEVLDRHRDLMSRPGASDRSPGG